MTQEEKEAFLAGVHVGVLSIPRGAEEAPLTAPLWYDYTPGGELWFVVGKTSRKAAVLSEGGRVSLCAQDENLPYRYVSVEGNVVSIRQSDGHLEPMAIRYLGEEMGQQYAAGSDEPGNVVVSVQPDTWLAVDYGKAAL